MNAPNNNPAYRVMAVRAMKKLPIFAGLIDDDYERLISICHIQQVTKGQQMFAEGDKAGSIYVLLTGEIQISTQKTGLVHTMKPGEILGEMGVISQGKRNATANISADSIILQLNQQQLENSMDMYPKIGYRIMRNIARILVDRLNAKAAQK